MRSIILCSDCSFFRRTVTDFLPSRDEYKISLTKFIKDIPYDKYDVIIIDKETCNGTALADTILSNKEIRSKILLLVSDISYEEIQAYKNIGLTNIIKKPFNIKTFKEKIKKVA
jgi:AmiR/NasT family two-component response regulator